MFEESFARRLSKLREAKKVSAREMSLSIGQNESYINRIENGKAFPSMQGFFYICEYLGVTPEEFFREQSADPTRERRLGEQLERLSPMQLTLIEELVRQLLRKESDTSGRFSL